MQTVTPGNKKPTFERIEINDFAELDSLVIGVVNGLTDHYPATAYISQRSGSMQFQFNMTSDQAHQMAKALMAAALFIDETEAEENYRKKYQEKSQGEPKRATADVWYDFGFRTLAVYALSGKLLGVIEVPDQSEKYEARMKYLWKIHTTGRAQIFDVEPLPF